MLLDTLWDLGDPAGSEGRLRAHLDRLDPEGIAAAELRTQVARALGLQGRFDEATAMLAGITGRHPVVLARLDLERGRVLNSSGKPGSAIPFFTRALDHARTADDDYLAVDALHMLAIVDSEHAAGRTREALGIAEASPDPRTRRWRGTLHNNAGWTLHDSGDFEGALREFEQAHGAFEETGTRQQVHIAHWTIARCLRSLGRNPEALEIQQRLADDDPPDEYVTEEIALLRRATG
jgi:tetratricopeptide (TPR) repeat protein